MWLTLITLKNEVHFPLILLFIMQGDSSGSITGPWCAVHGCFLQARPAQESSSQRGLTEPITHYQSVSGITHILHNLRWAAVDEPQSSLRARASCTRMKLRDTFRSIFLLPVTFTWSLKYNWSSKARARDWLADWIASQGHRVLKTCTTAAVLLPLAVKVPSVHTEAITILSILSFYCSPPI